MLTLGKHGWFLDLEMPFNSLWDLERALTSGNVEEAEQALIRYYQQRVSDIRESLRINYPRRDAIIRAAFNAHSRKEYELSVPVFLAQADGICQELVNFQLFTKKNKRPDTANYVETITADTFRVALLYPLTHPLPISASTRERGTHFDGLNRHQVLHGESVDYGTEVNSLKAISLLNYVAHVLKPDGEDEWKP